MILFRGELHVISYDGHISAPGYGPKYKLLYF